MKTSARAAFTFAELMVATAVFAGVSVVLMTYAQTSVRLIARNFSINQSHEAVRTANARMVADLHLSASAFRLMSFDGTTYTELSPTVTTDVDPLTGKFISQRGNGVRYRRLEGGPYKVTANTTSTSTNLTFDFAVGSTLSYIPQIGDKVVLPLITKEFNITAVPTVPTMASKTGVITISDAGGIGIAINATTAGNVTTGYFYREVAYSVFNGNLRFHKNFTSTNKTNIVVVRDRVTSTQPFGLLFPTAAAQVENTALRISLETYDSNYTGRRFSNGTATLQAVIPPLNNPTPISSTDYTP